MAFYRAFVRAAAAIAERAALRRRVIPRPGSGITVPRDTPSAPARPPFRPRGDADVVKEEDASRVADVLATNLRLKSPIRLSARLDIISKGLPLRLEELPIEIDPSLVPVLGEMVQKYLDAAAIALRDSITEEFKKQSSNTSVFTYVATRVAFVANILSAAGSILVFGAISYYLLFPDKLRARLDDLIKMVANSFKHAVSYGYLGETFAQHHERILKEMKAAQDLKNKEELEELVKRSLEERRRPAPRRLTAYEIVVSGLRSARAQGVAASSSSWDRGMSTVGEKEWLKSQR